MREPSESLHRLVGCVNLLDVSYLELVSRRKGNELSAEGGDVAVEAAPQYQLGVDRNDDGTRFRLRLKIEINGDFGDVIAEAAAEYEQGEFSNAELTQDLLVDFADHVAVMTLLPYLRQAIADLTQRVFDAPLLMPILPRGSVSFAPTAESADKATQIDG